MLKLKLWKLHQIVWYLAIILISISKEQIQDEVACGYIYNIIYFESGFIWNGVLTYKIFHIYFVPTKIFELIEN